MNSRLIFIKLLVLIEPGASMIIIMLKDELKK